VLAPNAKLRSWIIPSAPVNAPYVCLNLTVHRVAAERANTSHEPVPPESKSSQQRSRLHDVAHEKLKHIAHEEKRSRQGKCQEEKREQHEPEEASLEP
jgi:hypothetical protein